MTCASLPPAQNLKGQLDEAGSEAAALKVGAASPAPPPLPPACLPTPHPPLSFPQARNDTLAAELDASRGRVRDLSSLARAGGAAAAAAAAASGGGEALADAASPLPDDIRLLRESYQRALAENDELRSQLEEAQVRSMMGAATDIGWWQPTTTLPPPPPPPLFPGARA